MTETRTSKSRVNIKNITKLFAPTKRQIALGAGAFGLLIVGILLGVWLFLPKQRINPNTLQIVYMTNGQAYFGSLQNTTGDYLVLRDPYTTQSIESGEDGEAGQTKPTAALIRVSDQVYGPEDSIAIKTTQVTFWQNLRADSKVTAAIRAKEDK